MSDETTREVADAFQRKLERFLNEDSINSITLQATARGDAYRATAEGEVFDAASETRLTLSDTATGPTALAALVAVLRKVNW